MRFLVTLAFLFLVSISFVAADATLSLCLAQSGDSCQSCQDLFTVATDSCLHGDASSPITNTNYIVTCNSTYINETVYAPADSDCTGNATLYPTYPRVEAQYAIGCAALPGTNGTAFYQATCNSAQSLSAPLVVMAILSVVAMLFRF